MLYRAIALFIMMVCAPWSELSGQKGWEIGGWLGASYYFGDLQTDYNLKRPYYAGGLNGRYNINTRLAAKGSLNYARIGATDENSPNTFEQQRNLSFNSHIGELNAQFEFNFFPFVHGSVEEYYTPYLFGGLSAFYFNPTTELDGTRYTLRDYGTEGQPTGQEYLPFSMAISFGLGFKWDLSEEWSINVEISSRQVMTDYLDDVSTLYPDLDQLEAVRGSIARQLSDRSLTPGIGDIDRQRGNSKDNDSFNFIGISIMRYFGRLECPKISPQL